MKSKSIFFIALAVLIVSVSCMSTTQVSNNSGPTQEPQLSSPFAADATSPMSVQLTWKPVTGAQKYLLAVRLGDSEFIPVAELPADQTSFEDFPVPDSSELTYRLQAVTSSATSDVGTVTVTTTASRTQSAHRPGQRLRTHRLGAPHTGPERSLCRSVYLLPTGIRS